MGPRCGAGVGAPVGRGAPGAAAGLIEPGIGAGLGALAGVETAGLGTAVRGASSELARRLAHDEPLTRTRLVRPGDGLRLRPEDRCVARLRARRLGRWRRLNRARSLADLRACTVLGGGHTSGLGPDGRGQGRSRLLGLNGATQPFSVGLAPGAVGLRVLDRRRVALHTDP